MVTGNQIGSMDVRLNGRRLRNPAAIERVLSRGGEDSENVLNQLITQTGANDETERLIRDYASNLQSGRGRNRLDSDEQEDLVTRARSNDQLQEIQRRAVEERQRSQNPLDTTRNDLLSDIRTAVRQMAENNKGGDTVSEGAAE